MGELFQRLKMYEPLFGKWKIDFIAITYTDMAWVYLKDDYGNDALMKVKTLFCLEEDVENEVYELMNKYDILDFPDLTHSPYLEEEHYYIEDGSEVKGVDICLLSRYSLEEDNDQLLSTNELFQLGLQYMNGQDRVQDEYRAYQLFEKAAYHSHAKAICSLGYMNEVGLGTKVNKEQAVAFYQQAADLGDSLAACNYAYCCLKGIGCQSNLQQAFEYFEKSAQDQYPRAVYYLGECYCFGYGTLKDEMKAMTYYKQAVDLGYTQAKYSIGYCYEYGIGVAKDLEKAFVWYLDGAKDGLPVAQVQVGFAYEVGEGVKQDSEQAVYWYQQASSQNYAPAHCYLAYCYEMGIGTPVDLKKAKNCIYLVRIWDILVL